MSNHVVTEEGVSVAPPFTTDSVERADVQRRVAIEQVMECIHDRLPVAACQILTYSVHRCARLDNRPLNEDEVRKHYDISAAKVNALPSYPGRWQQFLGLDNTETDWDLVNYPRTQPLGKHDYKLIDKVEKRYIRPIETAEAVIIRITGKRFDELPEQPMTVVATAVPIERKEITQ